MQPQGRRGFIMQVPNGHGVSTTGRNRTNSCSCTMIVLTKVRLTRLQTSPPVTDEGGSLRGRWSEQRGARHKNDSGDEW